MTMPDIDKVVKGLECHSDPAYGCDACPYSATDGDEDCGWRELCIDAHALIREQQEQLKAQTPVKPVKSKLSWEHGYNWDIWDCGHCGSQLRGDANYCDRCGKAVKWE